MMTKILVMIGTTFSYSSPLIYAGLGGVISERGGVVNIGIEGMMTIGAIMAVTVAYYTGSPWLGFLAGGVAGMLLSLLHAIACVSLKANQTISGVAMNFLGQGLALFFARLFFDGATQTPPVPNKMPKVLSGLFDDLASDTAIAFNQDMAVILAVVAVIIMWVFLYRTKFGLRVRSVGEHPAASDTLGINVYKTRYGCVMASGFLAGLGGATMTLSVISAFSPTAISGHGYIALAAVIFGRWTPHGTFGACLLFGFAQALVVLLGGGMIALDTKILAMIPYVLTILVLILMRGKSVAPKAEGVPFDKGSH